MAIINVQKADDHSSVDLSFGYFKHGDMIQSFWQETKDPIKTLEAHKELLNEYVDMCNQIIEVLKPHDNSTVKLDGGAHCVFFYGPKSTCQELLDKGLAFEDEFENEDEELDDEEVFDDEDDELVEGEDLP